MGYKVTSYEHQQTSAERRNSSCTQVTRSGDEQMSDVTTDMFIYNWWLGNRWVLLFPYDSNTGKVQGLQYTPTNTTYTLCFSVIYGEKKQFLIKHDANREDRRQYRGVEACRRKTREQSGEAERRAAVASSTSHMNTDNKHVSHKSGHARERRERKHQKYINNDSKQMAPNHRTL